MGTHTPARGARRLLPGLRRRDATPTTGRVEDVRMVYSGRDQRRHYVEPHTFLAWVHAVGRPEVGCIALCGHPAAPVDPPKDPGPVCGGCVAAGPTWSCGHVADPFDPTADRCASCAPAPDSHP